LLRFAINLTALAAFEKGVDFEVPISHARGRGKL